jgi:hypothetical protein
MNTNMQKSQESNGSGALYLGTLVLIVIVSVVVWSEYKTYHLGTWLVLCAGVCVLVCRVCLEQT